MLELFFVACLISNPDSCENRSLLFSEPNVTPYQCLMKSQIELAKWRESNKRYSIMKVGCRRLNTQEKET